MVFRFQNFIHGKYKDRVKNNFYKELCILVDKNIFRSNKKTCQGRHYEYNCTCLVGRLLSIINDLKGSYASKDIRINKKSQNLQCIFLC